MELRLNTAWSSFTAFSQPERYFVNIHRYFKVEGKPWKCHLNLIIKIWSGILLRNEKNGT